MTGDVEAKRVGAKGSTRRLVGARAGTSAEGVVFAVAATVLKLPRIVERLEKGRFAVDIGHAVGANVSGRDGKETGRADLSGIRYEHDAVAIANARASKRAAAFHLIAGQALGTHELDGDTPVGRSLCGSDDEWRILRNVEDPGHEAFAVFGRKRLEHLTASDGNEKEHAPTRDAVRFEQLVDCGHVVRGFGGGERVDLNGNLKAAGPFDGLHGACERAGNAANGIMRGGGGTVEAESQAFNAGFLQPFENIKGEIGGSCGRNGNADLPAAGFGDQLEKVRAIKGIAAGKDQVRQGLPEVAELIEEGEALLVGKLIRVG